MGKTIVRVPQTDIWVHPSLRGLVTVTVTVDPDNRRQVVRVRPKKRL